MTVNDSNIWLKSRNLLLKFVCTLSGTVPSIYMEIQGSIFCIQIVSIFSNFWHRLKFRIFVSKLYQRFINKECIFSKMSRDVKYSKQNFLQYIILMHFSIFFNNYYEVTELWNQSITPFSISKSQENALFQKNSQNIKYSA